MREPEVLGDPRGVVRERPRRRSPRSRSPSRRRSARRAARSRRRPPTSWRRRCRRASSAIQSPATMGPNSALLSRTACVTSPRAHAPAASSIAAVFSSIDAWASYTTSAASASTTAAVGTTVTGRSASSGTWRATGTMFLLLGSTITPSAAHCCTASRICAVDGFIDCPPATMCCTPRLAKSCSRPSPTATATTPVATCSTGAPAAAVGLLPDPRRLFALLHLLVEVGHADLRGATGDDARLDGGADVVRVHVAVPDARRRRRRRSSRRARPTAP